jgi:integrase/recombinase XerD
VAVAVGDLRCSPVARRNSAWIARSELSSIIDQYVGTLIERGYSRFTTNFYRNSIAHFAHWMTRRHIGIEAINEDVLAVFIGKHLPRCRCAKDCQRCSHTARAALKILIGLLRSKGIIAARRPRGPQAIDQELVRLDQHLDEVRGLAPVTRGTCLLRVRAFLLDQFPTGAIRMDRLTSKDLTGFLSRYTSDCTPRSRAVVSGSIRTYLRFKSLSVPSLAPLCKPLFKTANWRMSAVPKRISSQEIEQLFASFDRSRPVGRRDYAMTRCIVDLGLRAIEVARLQLDDFDWSTGTVQIKGKGRRVDVMPIPASTGTAIVDYLQNGRVRTTSRALFMRHRPPQDTPARRAIVGNAIRYGAERCGLSERIRGPHALRHVLAERLVQAGTPLKGIADLLRHRSLDTTTTYAKADLPMLARVAQPWPGSPA